MKSATEVFAQKKVNLFENKYQTVLSLYMLGKLNIFLNCLLCFKLLEKTTNNFLAYFAVGAFLLIDIAGSIEYNRI